MQVAGGWLVVADVDSERQWVLIVDSFSSRKGVQRLSEETYVAFTNITTRRNTIKNTLAHGTNRACDVVLAAA